MKGGPPDCSPREGMEINLRRRIEEELSRYLNDSTKRRVLLYGRRGIGKTYTFLQVAADSVSNYIYINPESPQSKDFISSLDPTQTLADNLSNHYAIAEELLAFIPVIIDEFTNNDTLYSLIMSAIKERSLVRLFLITSDCSYPDTSTEQLFDTVLRMPEIGFDEYLAISGHEWYKEVILGHVESCKAIPGLIHDEISDLFDEYLCSGGDPLCISELLREESRGDLYDINKRRYSELIGELVINNPASMSADMIKLLEHIAENAGNRKYTFSTIRKGLTSKDFEEAINMLISNDTMSISRRKDSVDNFSIFLRDNGIYSYLIKKSGLYSPDEEKRLIEENYVRNLLDEKGIKHYNWFSGTRAFLNIIAETNENEIPISITTSSKRYRQYAKKYAEDNNLKKIINLGSDNISMNSNILNIPIYTAFCIENVIPQL